MCSFHHMERMTSIPPVQAEFSSSTEKPEYYSQEGFNQSSLTASDDSSEEITDQSQHSAVSQPWQDGSVFDGLDLPVITDANLYIKNIDYDISDEALYGVFSQLGEITGHHIIRDATKRSRGFGFMCVILS